MIQPNGEENCCTPQRGEGHATAQSCGGCAPPSTKATPTNTRGMKLLDGGAFLMGSETGTYPADGEGPVREVTLNPFYMDVCAVTNRQFEKFIKATKYKTEAESFGWSFVFHLLVPEEIAKKLRQHVDGLEWWWKVPGAYWRKPEGRTSSIKDRMDHPAVHISWADATAYAQWAGKRLPTEAEYEYAARGGRVQTIYPWGDELEPNGEHKCNVFQGEFPKYNSAGDGYIGTAPVRAFEPNDFGLYNTSGNIWEWCWDWFSPTFHIEGPRKNPHGPSEGIARVIRGGSYLCHESYCNRYRLSARTANTPDSSTGNMGFRCAVDVEE
jgi:formylglycine-generating enzyme required for sulfatase activity